MRADDFLGSSWEDTPYSGAWCVNDYTHLIVPLDALSLALGLLFAL